MTEPMRSDALRTRSWLFTPGNRPQRLISGLDSGADVIIIDLEDAVAPDHKTMARSEAIRFLANPVTRPVKRAIRINGLDTREGLADLSDLLDSEAQPDFIIAPKAESADVMRLLDRLLTRHRKGSRLVALVESVAGLNCCEALASSCNRMAALMVGAADMASDLGVEPDWDALAYTRARVVAATAGAGILALDSPYFRFDDDSGLRVETQRAVRLGFAAKAAIHPRQLAMINDALTPTPAELEEAEAIIAIAAQGVGVYKGRMIDEAMARRARRIKANA